MATEQFSPQAIVDLLRERRVATIDELKRALGTTVDMTVYRKLKSVAYTTSYSHRGRFYALLEVAHFDRKGLWSYGGAHFSKFGSLLDTAARFVIRSKQGCYAAELAGELQVNVKEPLLKLVNAGRLAREDVAGIFLYCDADPERRREQTLLRNANRTEGGTSWPSAISDETKAAIILFYTVLDEQRRRLFAGLESLRLGRGGDRQIAELMGLDVHTVSKGRRELVERDVHLDRIRKPGGGRTPFEKKRRK
jgi:hypothetical protein